jgi:ABC-type nickel/cobalt efflux system permease component RcnA
MESTTLATLLLGFALGVEHALEPDHVVAISTLLSQNRHPLKGALSGAFWGLGHTLTLFLSGLSVILFKLTIPYQLSLSLEFMVGIVLFVLGAQILWKHYRKRIHNHHHVHASKLPGHQHFHFHTEEVGHGHPHLTHHYKSLAVGMIHGLAGSAALMLLVLSTIQSPVEGIAYILLFGSGSILGMMVVSALLGLSFAWSSRRFASLGRAMQLVAGAASVVLGIVVMFKIGFVEGLIFKL